MKKTVFALITAAGKSSRMGGLKKELLEINGKPLIINCIGQFLLNSKISAVYVISPPDMIDIFRKYIKTFFPHINVNIVAGGKTRQESVYSGLKELKDTPPDIVLIHDGARPFVSEGIIDTVIEGAVKHRACAPVIPVTDTLKLIDKQDFITSHPDRSEFSAIQTPQAFYYKDIYDSHVSAADSGKSFTDDTEIYSSFTGKNIFSVQGSSENLKITYPEDIYRFINYRGSKMRIGQGYDIHRLVKNRKLIIGGAEIDFDKGSDAHSDGDVLIHSIIDAILGSVSMGDIGFHFPPADQKYKNISSRELLKEAAGKLTAAGFIIVNIDSTVILEKPRLRNYIDTMIKNLSYDLCIAPEQISVKAKTKETMDAAGQERAVEAYASVLVEKKAAF